ncbi:MAG: DinB family protein [Acidimicrobiales bacterium]|nr:MAG: DinB family protein [Acidimicrobiales bacterium]
MSAQPTERDVLLQYLNKNRQAVVVKTMGLAEEQLRAPGVPSGTNMLGIVHHLAGVEAHWFGFVFLGEHVDCDMAMVAPPELTASEVIGSYRAACRVSDEIVRAYDDLSTLAAMVNPGENELDSLRVILAHMIEETARHAGQADILRELIDGHVEE